MATGISPKLPLTFDDDDGAYKLNKTLPETIQQNFKNLVLTIPGERVMDPLFGVGVKQYLFEQNDGSVYALVAAKIREQASKYMPFIDIIDITAEEPQDPIIDGNHFFISITYRILPLDVEDMLNIYV